MESKQKYKSNSHFFFVYLAIVLIAMAGFTPVILNKFFIPFTNAGYVVSGSGIFNWSICSQNEITLRLSVSTLILMLVLSIILYVSVSGGTSKGTNKGDEHGSARFMTDDEFADLYPSYIFRPNEQECIRYSEDQPYQISKKEESAFDLLEAYVEEKEKQNEIQEK